MRGFRLRRRGRQSCSRTIECRFDPTNCGANHFSDFFESVVEHILQEDTRTLFGRQRLDEMFKRMAEIYDADTRAAIKRFTALFEPLVILVMGVMVGAMILSMLLAITSINDVAV